MRAEKKILTQEYLKRLNASPFFIVVDYKGMTVIHMNELRKRLAGAKAEVHVVKNSVFRIAAKEAGVGDMNGSLAGQLAVVSGQKDISTAAKVVKTFGGEFEKLKIQFGYLNNQRLEQAEIVTLADLPSIAVRVLRSEPCRVDLSLIQLQNRVSDVARALMRQRQACGKDRIGKAGRLATQEPIRSGQPRSQE